MHKPDAVKLLDPVVANIFFCGGPNPKPEIERSPAPFPLEITQHPINDFRKPMYQPIREFSEEIEKS